MTFQDCGRAVKIGGILSKSVWQILTFLFIHGWDVIFVSWLSSSQLLSRARNFQHPPSGKKNEPIGRKSVVENPCRKTSRWRRLVDLWVNEIGVRVFPFGLKVSPKCWLFRYLSHPTELIKLIPGEIMNMSTIGLDESLPIKWTLSRYRKNVDVDSR